MQHSDLDFESQVTTAIQRAVYRSGRNLRCESHEGHVTLHGTVDSYYQKQMAQEATRRVDGVERIANLLEVACARHSAADAIAL